MPVQNTTDTIKRLKKEGYYIRTNRSRSYLLHPSSGTEIAIEDLVHPSKRGEVFEALPKINCEVFQPKRPSLIPKEGGYFQLNTWKPYQTAGESSEGDLSLWLEFLERLFPNAEERRWVVMYLAHMLQKPEERPSYAIMLTSQAGTGKGVLFHRILKPLLAGQAVQNDNYGAFTGKHSNSLHGAILCMLDDPKSDHPSTMTKLKSRISEPTTLFEEKYEQPRTVPVFTRIILASNERTPLILDESDMRRWYVPSYIQHRVDEQETQIFIAALLEGLSLDAIHRWFLGQSLDDFNPFSPPKTDTLLGMVERSKSSLHQELVGFLEERPVFKWDCLKISLEGNHPDKEIRDHLREIGYQSKRITVMGKKQTFWFHCEMEEGQIRTAASGYLESPFAI